MKTTIRAYGMETIEDHEIPNERRASVGGRAGFEKKTTWRENTMRDRTKKVLAALAILAVLAIGAWTDKVKDSEPEIYFSDVDIGVALKLAKDINATVRLVWGPWDCLIVNGERPTA